ncbi:MAG: hypothetical protein JHC24_03000 [Thaumarchaeota archaeon]|nr:hypothetical protein [Nitrososphaerota archaeon]
MPEKVPDDVRGQLKWAKERIDSQLQKLNRISSDVDRREKALFERVVSLSKSGDPLRAEKYSEELSQVRKLRDTVRALSATLDAVSLKLEGTIGLGDAVAAISGARAIVANLSRQVKGMNPEIDRSIAEISDVLTSTQQMFSEIYIPTSPDSESILKEAEAVAEVRRRQAAGLGLEVQPQRRRPS